MGDHTSVDAVAQANKQLEEMGLPPLPGSSPSEPEPKTPEPKTKT